MQFSRYLTYSKSSSPIRIGFWTLKMVLATASFYYVISKIITDRVAFKTLNQLFTSLEFVFVFGVVTILMVFNWLFESKKWQLIAKKYQSIGLFQALKAILSGISLDAVVPFGAGAVSSKVLSLKQVERNKLIAPVIFAQGIQSFWTVLFGFIGLSQLDNMTNISAIYGRINVYFFVMLLSMLLMAIVAFWPQLITYIIQSVKSVSITTWVKVVLISFFRYLLFFTQLILLSIYLAPQIPIQVLVGCITWMFFAKTIVPKPGHLGALGIRGASVVYFLSLAGYSAVGVVMATLILWCINLAFPSLVGLFFIKELNLKSEKE